MPIYNHPKYITDASTLSRCAREICNSHPLGYWGGLVYGSRGRGKTAFCLHTQREVYQYKLGITYDDAWELTLKHIMFSLEDIDNMFNILDTIDFSDTIKWQEDNTVLCTIWDDAGMHGGKFKYFVATKMVEHLQGNMDVIRFILTGFLINAPEISNLLSFLRTYRDHKIIKIAYRTEGKNDYDRVARIKQWKEDKLGRWHLMTIGATKFSCYVDDWVYREYSAMKAKAIMENRHQFLDAVKKAEKMENKPQEEILKDMGLPENFEDVDFDEKMD